MNDAVPSPSLYGPGLAGTPDPGPKPQRVWDQLIGLFTDPAEVFRRLRRTPNWLPAFLLFLGVSIGASVVWAAKVDQVTMVQRRFEVTEQVFGKSVPSEVVDQALNQAETAKPPYISATAGTFVGMSLGYLVFAAILLAFAKFGSEDEGTTFRHALAATTVHALVALPIPLLAGLMALAKEVGGASSYASLAPTNPAFWIQPENPWVRGLCFVLDPFYLYSFVTLYLAGRYTLGLKKGWNVALLILMGIFGVLSHFMGGVFA